MATNEIYRNGDSLAWPVAQAVSSGDIVVFASGLVGFAEVDAHIGDDDSTYFATVRHIGVFSVPMGTGAIAAGTSLYASSTPSAGLGVVGTPTATATSNTKIGTVLKGKPNAAGNVWVRIGG